MGYRKPKVYELRGSAKKMAKILSRGKKASILKQLLSKVEMQQHAAKVIGRLVQLELKSLCSDKNASIFRVGSKKDMMDFQWESLWQELNQKAPLLLGLLQHACPVKRQLPKPVLCTLAAILLKHRNNKMCKVQAMFLLFCKQDMQENRFGYKCNVSRKHSIFGLCNARIQPISEVTTELIPLPISGAH